MKFKQAVKVGVGTGLVSDDLTLLALAQRWPVATWFNWKVRNLSDDHLRRIAATSGLIGVGFWETACCGQDRQPSQRPCVTPQTSRALITLAWVLTSTGAVTMLCDASGMAQLTAALLQEGFNAGEIRQVRGGNLKELLRNCLPDSS